MAYAIRAEGLVKNGRRRVPATPWLPSTRSIHHAFIACQHVRDQNKCPIRTPT